MMAGTVDGPYAGRLDVRFPVYARYGGDGTGPGFPKLDSSKRRRQQKKSDATSTTVQYEDDDDPDVRTMGTTVR